MSKPDSLLAPQSCVESQENHFGGELSKVSSRLETTMNEREAELEYLKNKGKLIARELDLFRQRRAVQWMDRFRNRFDTWNMMASCFQQLKDDCVIFNGDLKGFILQPSTTLNRVPFVSYKIFVDRPNLSAVLLALIIDFPSVSGEVGIQIASADNVPLAEATQPVAMVHDDAPTVFEFSPISNSDEQKLTLKVFVRGADLPIRLFEMRRYTLLGLGSLKSKAFCGFRFDEQKSN